MEFAKQEDILSLREACRLIIERVAHNEEHLDKLSDFVKDFSKNLNEELELIQKILSNLKKSSKEIH